jgi:hypothetical protein
MYFHERSPWRCSNAPQQLPFRIDALLPEKRALAVYHHQLSRNSGNCLTRDRLELRCLGRPTRLAVKRGTAKD